MTFWQAIKSSYVAGTAFCVAFPLLIAIPVAFELVQHVVEMQRGMYDGIVGARAADSDPVRLAFGMVKIFGLLLPSYWLARYIASGRDRSFVTARAPMAWRLFAKFIIVNLALAAVQLFILPRTGPLAIVALLTGIALSSLLMVWPAAAALGNPVIGPLASIQLMWRHILFAIGLTVVGILPLMIPHYAAALGAVLLPAPWKWPILMADSLLVGWLSAVLGAATYQVAVRACERAGVALEGILPTAAKPYS